MNNKTMSVGVGGVIIGFLLCLVLFPRQKAIDYDFAQRLEKKAEELKEQAKPVIVKNVKAIIDQPVMRIPTGEKKQINRAVGRTQLVAHGFLETTFYYPKSKIEGWEYFNFRFEPIPQKPVIRIVNPPFYKTWEAGLIEGAGVMYLIFNALK